MFKFSKINIFTIVNVFIFLIRCGNKRNRPLIQIISLDQIIINSSSLSIIHLNMRSISKNYDNFIAHLASVDLRWTYITSQKPRIGNWILIYIYRIMLLIMYLWKTEGEERFQFFLIAGWTRHLNLNSPKLWKCWSSFYRDCKWRQKAHCGNCLPTSPRKYRYF